MWLSGAISPLGINNEFSNTDLVFIVGANDVVNPAAETNPQSPIFGMPIVLQWLSQIFPFTHFFELLLDQSQRGFPVFYSLKSIIILVVLSIVPISLGWFKLKRLFSKGVFNHSI